METYKELYAKYEKLQKVAIEMYPTFLTTTPDEREVMRDEVEKWYEIFKEVGLIDLPYQWWTGLGKENAKMSTTTTNYATIPYSGISSGDILAGGEYEKWFRPTLNLPDSIEKTKVTAAITKQEQLAEEAKKKNLSFAVVVHEAIAEALRSLL